MVAQASSYNVFKLRSLEKLRSLHAVCSMGNAIRRFTRLTEAQDRPRSNPPALNVPVT